MASSQLFLSQLGTIDSMKSILTQSALDVLYEKFHIPDIVHHELPGLNDRIRSSPTEIDMFAFIHHADPTKGNQNNDVQDGRVPVVNEESGDVVVADQIEGGDHVIQDEWVDFVRIEDEVPAAAAAEKAKVSRKKRKELFERSTLNVKVGVTAAATVPFVTSSVSLTPEREGVGRIDSTTRAHLHPLIMSTAVDTMVAANISSILVPRVGDELVHASIFTHFASVGTVGPDVARPSQPVGTELSAYSFYVSHDIDSEMLRQIYVPKWDVLNESALDDSDMVARQTCLGTEVRMRLEHTLREKKRLKGIFNKQVDLLKERNAKIANLKAQLYLREVGELDGLKERNVALEGQVVAFDSADAAKGAELASLTAQTAKLTQDLSELGYKLFKEHIEAVQDEQVRVLSEKMVGLDSELMDYLTTLGKAISRAIDKGMHDGLAASIDHGKAGRGFADVAAYDPFVKANFVSAVNALRAIDFPLLAQLASQKDASITDIMGSLNLEGPAAETPKAGQLQPSSEQLMLLIHRLEDQMVIGDISLSFSLDVVHSRVKRIRGYAAFQRLSIFEAMIPLIEPLSSENLIGESSISRAPATATTTALSTTFIQTNFVPSVLVADHGALYAGSSTKVPPSPKIVFEKEELDTTPEHTGPFELVASFVGIPSLHRGHMRPFCGGCLYLSNLDYTLVWPLYDT
nr:hypothetical protein [Tanacetum cinerariifolium]